ncbi:MAG: hypothetical protein JWQ62_416, partial [Lacunisphaera sp.]|nr:hypothetical protein [Lacunisphaera sp.]
NATLRRAALQAYLKNGDRHLLETAETRWILTQNPEVVTRWLDQPGFRHLLPSSVDPASPPDWAGRFCRGLQARWPALLLGGLGLLLAGSLRVGWRGSPVALPPLVPGGKFRRSQFALGVAVMCTGLLFLWGDPLTFDSDWRWQQVLGGPNALPDLSFSFASVAPFGDERLQGAAPIRPFVLRNKFFGTAPAGPEFTGTVLSSPFLLTKPWLIVPYAGYPVGNGNGLRIRVVDEHDETVGAEIGCGGPNLDGIGFWAADVHEHRGQRARLVLYDGRADSEAWVAAAPPIPSDSAGLATSLALRLEGEKHAALHLALGIIAGFAYVCAALLWVARRVWPAGATERSP